MTTPLHGRKPEVGPQPVVNPAHTHVQVQFVNGSTLFFPIHHQDAAKAIDAWRGGSPAFTLRGSDGDAWTVNTGGLLFVRQVTAEVASAIIAEHAAEQKRAADLRKAAEDQARAARARAGVIATP